LIYLNMGKTIDIDIGIGIATIH